MKGDMLITFVDELNLGSKVINYSTLIRNYKISIRFEVNII